jgi:hypothetical protein
MCKLLTLLAFTSTPALATPVYLLCPISSEDGKNAVNIDLTLNEETGTASYFVKETGSSVANVPAAFTPTVVSWERTLVPHVTMRHSVDRTTLTYQEVIYVASKPTDSRTGTCVISKIKQRKF